MPGFFDNPYMLYGEDDNLNPDRWWEDQDVFEGDPSAPPDAMLSPTAPPQGPRMIPPRMDQDRPMYDQYLETLRGVPMQKQASTWDKIFAGITGVSRGILSRDPSAGLAAYESVLRSPYERELSDWKTKVGAAGEAAGLEEKELSADMDYAIRSGQLENVGRANEIRQQDANTKAEQARNNYEVAKGRLAELQKSNADKKAIADATNALNQSKLEVDKHQAESQRIQAEAARTRAGAYSGYLGAGGGMPKPADVNDMYNAEQDVLMELMATDPLFQKFYKLDPESQSVIPIMPGDEGWSEEDAATREALQSKIGLETQKRLGGLAGGGAPPLWRMRPNVVIPPERRRIR